jgi:hypothetical protein
LSADTATFEGDMGRAAQIAERNSQRMVRSTKETSTILRELGQGASIINFSGFDGLVKGSGVAKEALHGLAGAIGLIGIASWPVAAAVAAAGALSYFATESMKASEAAKQLKDDNDKLYESLHKNADAPFLENLGKQTLEFGKLSQALREAQHDYDALQKQFKGAGLSDAAIAASPAVIEQLQKVNELQGQVAAQTKEVTKAEKELADTRNNQYQNTIQPITSLIASLQQEAATYGDTGRAVLEYRLTVGDLSEAMRGAGADAQGYIDWLLDIQQHLDALAQAKELADHPITPIDLNSKKLNKVTKDASTEAEEYAKQARQNIQDILGTGLYDALKGNFDDILSSFADMILQMIAQAYAARIALSLTGSGSAFGNFLAGISGSASTGHAMGGNVLAGVPTTVNEMSRSGFPGETFIPNVPGVVVPAGGAGGGFTFNMPVDARGADAGAAARLLQAVPVIEKRIQAKVEFFASRGRWPGG